jgi:MSHA biogenesis protein MshK
MRPASVPWWLIAALAAAAPAALAQASTAPAGALADPTRPPVVASEEGTAAPVLSTQLQAILISRGRKLAVINGQTVPLGGRVGEGRVERITETEVTVRTGEQVEVLRLLPGIEKKPARRIARSATQRRIAPEGGGRP